MNDAHLHLLVNHVPIIGGLFASLILVWGIIKNNRSIIGIALVAFVVLGVASFVAHSTGEGAEEILEHGMTTYDHHMIHEHEEAAFPAHIAMVITAFASLITLVVRKLREGRVLPIFVLVLSILTFVLMARAGNLGGKINHPEVSNGISPATDHDGD